MFLFVLFVVGFIVRFVVILFFIKCLWLVLVVILLILFELKVIFSGDCCLGFEIIIFIMLFLLLLLYDLWIWIVFLDGGKVFDFWLWIFVFLGVFLEFK